MILRRYFDIRDLNVEVDESPELLVTCDTVTGELHVGFRRFAWEPFSVALVEAAREEDPDLPGRAYPEAGRTYVTPVPPTGGASTAYSDLPPST